jgi:hypothetical protein
MEAQYAQAVFNQAHKEGADAKVIVRQLAAYLEKTGRTKLLPNILRELLKLEARSEKLQPLVEVAHKKDEAMALAEAAKHGINAPHAHGNHDLIQGWRATGNGKLVDHSGKQALIGLYQNITTA